MRATLPIDIPNLYRVTKATRSMALPECPLHNADEEAESEGLYSWMDLSLGMERIAVLEMLGEGHERLLQ
jgi:hypothetical protein